MCNPSNLGFGFLGDSPGGFGGRCVPFVCGGQGCRGGFLVPTEFFLRGNPKKIYTIKRIILLRVDTRTQCTTFHPKRAFEKPVGKLQDQRGSVYQW